MRWPWGHRSFTGDENLFEAMTRKDLPACSRLLSRNPRLTRQPNAQGLLPVQFAVANHEAGLLYLLLQHGATVPMDTWNPLWIALLDNQPAVMEVLLKAGLSPHVPDAQGSFPLYYAAKLGLTEAVHLLLKHGAEADVRDAEGDTPLMGAAAEGHLEVVTVLLKAGARVHLRNFDGLAALDKARDSEVRQLLAGYTDVG